MNDDQQSKPQRPVWDMDKPHLLAQAIRAHDEIERHLEALRALRIAFGYRTVIIDA